ncbi:hypothetical protein LLH23_17685 [bacterium]|nr:hypothetical protein [bacterium]
MSRRALVIGIVAVLVIGVATPYSDLVMRGTWVGLTAFPINALFVLGVLTALNGLVRVGPRVLTRPSRAWGHARPRDPGPREHPRGLSPAEMLVIYAMALVAGGIPSFGLTGLLIPYIAGPFYFARPENRYEQVLQPLLPQWVHPRSEYAVVKLYEGLREGQPIPWGEWVGPLAAWTLLAFIMYVAFFCLTTLLRKRWVDDEKLVFPLLQLPLALCVDTGAGTGGAGRVVRASSPQPASGLEARTTLPGFLRDPVMWAFFAVPFAIHALNGLHYYLPALPTINVHQVNLGQYLSQRPWNAMQPLYMRTLFSIIGLAYVLPSELSFSLWFFYFFFLAQTVVASALGIPMRGVQAYGTKELVAHQMWGGILASGVLGLLAARPRLAQIWAEAFGARGGARSRGAACPHAADSAVDRARVPTRAHAADHAEPLPYRLALIGLGGSLVALGLWGSAAGAQFVAVLVLMALFFLSHIVAVRLVCEGGMLYVQHPFRPFNMLLAGFGARGLGSHNTAILAYLDHLWMVDNRSPLMPGLMQSWKLADEGGINRRQLAQALALAIVLAVLSSYVSYLRLMYRYGGSTLHQWFTTYYTRNLYCNWTMQLLDGGEAAKPMSFLTMGAGALSLGALTFLHHQFLWWPLHPIGYLMGASWPMINFWFPVFVGWLCKTAILHYGGPRVYRRLLPGFLGLVLAEFTAAGLWVVVDCFTGVRGHEVFSF